VYVAVLFHTVNGVAQAGSPQSTVATGQRVALHQNTDRSLTNCDVPPPPSRTRRRLYLGGVFSKLNGQTRLGLARVNGNKRRAGRGVQPHRPHRIPYPQIEALRLKPPTARKLSPIGRP